MQCEELILNDNAPDFDEEKLNLIVDGNDFTEELLNFPNINKNNHNYDYGEVFFDKGIIKVINTLTNRQKEVIYMCIVLGETDTFVAKELKITKQAVNKIRLTALKKIKKQLNLI